MMRFLPAALLAGFALSSAARAQDRQPWRVDLEAGASFQSLNDVRIPGRTGTAFDMNRLQHAPVSPFLRAGVEWDPWARHGFRLSYQYLRNEGTGTLPGPTVFAGGSFAPGVATQANYRFDTWRATYRYTLFRGQDFRFRIGVTGLIRDAEIRLSQAGLVRRDSNVGFVPLIHAGFDWRFAPGLTLMGEVDALGASQGRAIDAGLRLGWDVDRNWQALAGYRFLDGGVDNSSTFNFARFHSLTLGVAYRF